MGNVTIHVEGMSCNHCVESVENALLKIGAKAKVSLSSKSVYVEYDVDKLKISQLEEAIVDQGFDLVK